MKLYRQIKEELKSFGELRLFLSTSFNLNYYFIEKYIVSALANKSHEEIKTIYDLESALEEFKEKQCDIVFFHDYRAVDLSQPKRTSIPAVPTDPKSYGNQFEGGVFHPKVTLMVNKDFKAKLIVSSANLTIGGYGKNVESVRIKNIDTETNANEVLDFFKALNVQEYLEYNSDFAAVRSEILKNCNKNDSGWRFISSLKNEKLFDFFDTKSSEGVIVWSPYFSDNFEDIHQNYFSASSSELMIVPDQVSRSRTNKIRIPDGCKEYISNSDNNIFLKEDLKLLENSAAEKPLVHAKVWMNKNQMAIGSWNFTTAGLNLSERDNNIEAGIIESIGKKQFEEFRNRLSPINSNVLYSSPAELKEEKENILDSNSEVIPLFLDWEELKVFYKLPQNASLKPELYSVKLPGNDNLSLIDLQQGYSIQSKIRTFLKDRFYEVYKDTKLVYKASFIELKGSYRSAIGYENLSELLKSLLDTGSSYSDSAGVVRYTTEDDFSDAERIAFAQKEDNYIGAYFILFYSMENYLSKINNCQSKEELKRIAVSCSGNLYELKEHIEEYIKEQATEPTDQQNKENQSSDVYQLFLIREFNNLVIAFNQKKYFSLIEPIEGPEKLSKVLKTHNSFFEYAYR